MKRYTVFDAALGCYVVPLPKGADPIDPPTIGWRIGGPQDLLFGEVVDHLARLEIDAEEAERAEKESGHWTRTDEWDEEYGYRYRCSCCFCHCLGTSDFCPNCGADMREEANE